VPRRLARNDTKPNWRDRIHQRRNAEASRSHRKKTHSGTISRWMIRIRIQRPAKITVKLNRSHEVGRCPARLRKTCDKRRSFFASPIFDTGIARRITIHYDIQLLAEGLATTLLAGSVWGAGLGIKRFVGVRGWPAATSHVGTTNLPTTS